MLNLLIAWHSLMGKFDGRRIVYYKEHYFVLKPWHSGMFNVTWIKVKLMENILDDFETTDGLYQSQIHEDEYYKGRIINNVEELMDSIIKKHSKTKGIGKHYELAQTEIDELSVKYNIPV